MTKVLIFAMRFPPEAVGTALYAANLARGLAERRIEVTVLAPEYDEAAVAGEGGGGKPEAAYAIRRIRGGHHSVVALRYPHARTALKEALSELRPDALWATNGMATRVAGTLIDRLQVPVIGSLHGTDVTTRFPGRTPRTWIESIPQRRFYERADRLVTNSQFTLDMAVQKRISPEKLRLVYLGIDLPDPVSSNGTAKLPPDLQGRQLVLTVGRLVKQKGHKVLIEAMGRVLQNRPKALHVIVGDGPERGALDAQIRAQGLERNIRLAGRVSDAELRAYYEAASVFALSSRGVDSYVEGLGFVFLEAAARGVAAVGTRHGGIPEVIVDGETGYLIDPDSPDEFGQRIGRLLDDEALCAEMGRRARRRVEEKFSVDRMMDECRAVLAEVLS